MELNMKGVTKRKKTILEFNAYINCSYSSSIK